VLHALGDDDLRRRLGREARQTFERLFATPVAAGRIADELERIARPRALTAVS
jgi:hypothetical protein